MSRDVDPSLAPPLEILARDAYAPLWRAARRRLEGNGRSLDGSPMTLRGLSVDEADAVAGLLGVPRPSPGAPLRVRLDRLDAALRSSAADRGLADVLEAFGGPIVDRRNSRAEAVAARDAHWEALRRHPAVAADEPLIGWLDHVRSRGLDRRLAGDDAPSAMRSALDVVAALHDDPARPAARRLGVLAADVTGDAHGLDRGEPVASLAVHALSWLADRPFPRDAADWRRTWAESGVACDDLSCDVLALNLPGWPSEPLRFTLRQVTAWTPPGSVPDVVFACENPVVVASAADEVGASSPPLVCLDGMPSTAALVVLERLAAAGSQVHYHGDFDWRGLVIAGVVARKIPGVRPWRYSAAEYRRAVGSGLGSIALGDKVAESPWDTDLAAAMDEHGLAIYEEHVLTHLVADLTEWSPREDPGLRRPDGASPKSRGR